MEDERNMAARMEKSYSMLVGKKNIIAIGNMFIEILLDLFLGIFPFKWRIL